MLLTDLLVDEALRAAPRDDADLTPIRERVLARLRERGFSPAGPMRGRPGPPLTDAGLLVAYLQGDVAAFEGIFDRYAARLQGYARRFLRGADAADAVQEAFVVLFERAGSLAERAEPDLGRFLFAAVRYKVLRALAAREIPEADPGEDVPTLADDGLTAALRRETAAELAALLERTCNPLEQQVVLLHLEGFSDAEIAAQLGITEGHVRVVRHRALGKLRRAYAPEAG